MNDGRALQTSGFLQSVHSRLKHLTTYKPVVMQIALVMSASLLSEIWSDGEAHNALLVVVTDLVRQTVYTQYKHGC